MNVLLSCEKGNRFMSSVYYTIADNNAMSDNNIK